MGAIRDLAEVFEKLTPLGFIELSTAQVPKQFETISAQNKELCALAQKMATEVLRQSREACPRNHLINLKTAKLKCHSGNL